MPQGPAADREDSIEECCRTEPALPLLVQIDLKNCFLGSESCAHAEDTIGPKPVAVPVALQHGMDLTLAVKQSAIMLAEAKARLPPL